MFRIFGTHSSDGMSLFSSSSSQLMEFLARGMSPDDEYLNCLAGEGSAWDLIASYAYCAFYVWVIIVYRDDLTPVYRLWYDYIFHPAIELPTPPEKRKGVHRGSKCRVLDFVSADFDAPSVVHRRVTIVCHYDKDKKKRTSHVNSYRSYRWTAYQNKQLHLRLNIQVHRSETFFKHFELHFDFNISSSHRTL